MDFLTSACNLLGQLTSWYVIQLIGIQKNTKDGRVAAPVSLSLITSHVEEIGHTHFADWRDTCRVSLASSVVPIPWNVAFPLSSEALSPLFLAARIRGYFQILLQGLCCFFSQSIPSPLIEPCSDEAVHAHHPVTLYSHMPLIFCSRSSPSQTV